MIISCCSFGSSGSSAVTDYLKEFEENQVLDDMEFCWIWITDSLIDLERHLMNPHARTKDSIIAIERFEALLKAHESSYAKMYPQLSGRFEKSGRTFIDSITQATWFWRTPKKPTLWERRVCGSLLMQRLIPRLEKRRGERYNGYPYHPVKFSVKPENYFEAAQKHILEILVGMGADFTKNVVLDQAFPGNDPACCFPYVQDPRAIVTDRDPRDMYIFAKTKLLGRNHFMACDDVHSFITYYRGLRDEQPYQTADERILRVQFEDMVYNYEQTTEKIREFCQLPQNPRPRSIFNPDMSKANTQVFLRFPQYEDDIRVIEQELKEYLFDFSGYERPDFSKPMFMGKSPLNTR